MPPITESFRVLWISDIHYKKYSKSSSTRVHDYIVHFVNVVKNINASKNIDYIILLGDISFDGSAISYQLFIDEFLKKLLVLFDPMAVPKVITIPGNHDVNWKRTHFFLKYLSNFQKDKNAFLQQNMKSFKSLFKDYSNAFCFSGSNELRNALNFDKNNLVNYPNSYIIDKLFGYVVDRTKNVLFIMLNSAWYSIGSKFNRILIKHVESNVGKKNNLPQKLLKEKELIQEYGGQIVGWAIMDEINLLRLTSDYADFAIIICMHHPFNWLEWSEKYSEDQDSLQLPKLLQNADLILTGHEHVPSHIAEEILSGDTIHLKAGRFLADQIIDGDDSFSNNRFSILDIDKVFTRPSVQETKYVYNQKQWKVIEQEQLSVKKKRSRLRLNELNECSRNFKVSDYVVNEIIRDNTQVLLNEKEMELDGVRVKIIIRDSTNHLYVFSENMELLFKQIIDSPNLLKLWLGKVPSYCTFIFQDIFVDKQLTLKYSSMPSFVRYEMLNNVVHRADHLFDEFRINFFNKTFDDDSTSLKFSEIINIKLINHIIPYWIWEKYSLMVDKLL